MDTRLRFLCAGYSTVARAALSVALILALANSGCAVVVPSPPEYARHERGVVRMNRRARRRLTVLEHTWHRDQRGHLVARLRLRNDDEQPVPVEMRVVFFRQDGTPEREVIPAGREELPGSGRIVGLEWTSYTPEADRYEVDMDIGGLLPW